MIHVAKDNIKEYLDWVKNMIQICSAAIGALVFKFDSGVPWEIKTSAVLFIVTMISLFVAYSALVEHRTTTGEVMLKRHSAAIIVSWVLFLLSFGFLVANFF